MRYALLLLAACATAPAAAPDPLPLDPVENGPSAALFLQRPEDIERFRAFVAQVRARQPARFSVEHAGRGGGASVVEEVAWDGQRYDYRDGSRRLLCNYLDGTRLTGCRTAEMEAPQPDEGLEGLEGL
jgi:hypothetical protein